MMYDQVEDIPTAELPYLPDVGGRRVLCAPCHLWLLGFRGATVIRAPRGEHCVRCGRLQLPDRRTHRYQATDEIALRLLGPW